MIEHGGVKKRKYQKKKVVEKAQDSEEPEKKQIGTGTEDCPIKIEDYDSYEELEMVGTVENEAEDVDMEDDVKEEEFEVKIEPIDDYKLANPYCCWM